MSVVAGCGSSDESESESKQQVEIIAPELYSEESRYGVRGQIKNSSGEELTYVEVQVFFLDSEKTRIGRGRDTTTELPAGERWWFNVSYDGADSERVDAYEIETEAKV